MADPSWWLSAEEPFAVVQWGSGEPVFRGVSAFSALSGAGWHWDGVHLRVWSDRYGMAPLLYFRKAGSLGVSPSLVRLVAEGAPRDLDEPALAVFLRLGFFLAEDTPFQSIRALPPGSVLYWENGHFSLNSTGISSPPSSDLTVKGAMEGFQERFQRAITRRPPKPGPTALPLSGGRDSRHILLALQESGNPPDFCLTARNQFPDRPDRDIPRAVAMARSLNLRHEVVGARQSWFQQRKRANLVQGFLADENAWYLTVADHLHGRAATVYDGLAGDVLAAGLYLWEGNLKPFRSGNLALATDGILGTLGANLGGEETLSRVLAPRLQHVLSRDVARERLAREVSRHMDAANPVGAFFFWNRTRREVALQPFRLLRGVANVYTPFLDPEVVDFLMALPAERFLDGDFHSRTIRRAYPRYAQIPFGEGKGDHPHPEREYGAFGRELIRYYAASGPGTWMRKSFLWPRLAPCFLGKGCAGSFWYAQAVLYLRQLESLWRGEVAR